MENLKLRAGRLSQDWTESHENSLRDTTRRYILKVNGNKFEVSIKKNRWSSKRKSTN
jgi:hypothetical protein